MNCPGVPDSSGTPFLLSEDISSQIEGMQIRNSIFKRPPNGGQSTLFLSVLVEKTSDFLQKPFNLYTADQFRYFL